MTKTIEQKTLRFIDENRLIVKSDKVLVAFSGGADSVFLLYFLLKFKKRLGIELSAFHLNHKLRGRSANSDEKFCAKFCSERDIKFKSVSRDVKTFAQKKKISLEEAGREIRYVELLRAAEKSKATKIATAHNASDNTETVLLNFVKGAGIKGLTGIPLRRDKIIRPILCFSSDEIREYLKANRIAFRLDASNLDADYERNFLRNKIIPKLKRRLNPRLDEKIGSTSRILSEINLFLEKQIKQKGKRVTRFDGKELKVNLKHITKLDSSLRNLILKSEVENNFKIELSSDNIHSLTALLKSQTGRTIHLKEKIVAYKERDLLIITKRSRTVPKFSKYRINIGQRIELENKVFAIEKINRKSVKFNQDKSIEYISGDSLEGIFEIRKWKAGDKFQPIGMKGSKNISDFLSDEKIYSAQKKENLILTNSGKIVWVIGLRIDERFKVTPKTKIIYKLAYKQR